MAIGNRFYLTSLLSTSTPGTIIGAVGQTGNLLDFKDNTLAYLLSVNNVGQLARAGSTIGFNLTGAISLSAVAGQAITLTGNGGSLSVTSTGGISIAALASQLNTQSAAAHYFVITGTNRLLVTNTGTTVTDNLTVNGTGVHTFSGPILVSGSPGVIDRAFRVDVTTTGGVNILAASVANAKRQLQTLEPTTNDYTFNAYTGVAGSEVGIEALRIVNATGNVTVSKTLTVNGAGTHTFAGIVSVTTTTNSQSSLIITDTGSNGANIRLVGNGTTPKKTIRSAPTSGNFEIVNDAYTIPILKLSDVGDLTITGTIIVNGTGTNLFAGPIKVTTSGANTNSFWVDRTDALAGVVVQVSRTGAIRLREVNEATTFDTLFQVATGVAGSEVYTEGLRIVNANGKVSATVGFGVKTATITAGYDMDVAGSAIVQGQLFARSASAAQTPGKFQQTAATSTVPVLIVQLGATPSADAFQVQDSAGSPQMYITSNNGSIVTNVGSISAGGAVIANVRASFYAGSAGVVPMVLRGYTAQTANIQELQDSTGTPLTLVRNDGLGSFVVKGVATMSKAGIPTDADWTVAPPNGTIVVDSTNNKIMIRVGGLWKGVVIA